MDDVLFAPRGFWGTYIKYCIVNLALMLAVLTAVHPLVNRLFGSHRGLSYEVVVWTALWWSAAYAYSNQSKHIALNIGDTRLFLDQLESVATELRYKLLSESGESIRYRKSAVVPIPSSDVIVHLGPEVAEVVAPALFAQRLQAAVSQPAHNS